MKKISGICLLVIVFCACSKEYRVTIKNVSLEVEVANTDYLRKVGLMGRKHLDDHKGMLFMFPDEAVRSFWMKNTLVPLSIAYIKSNGEIAQIMDMEPDQWAGNLRSYVSSEKVKYALEVNQGWFSKHEIKVGDKIYFSRSIRKTPILE